MEYQNVLYEVKDGVAVITVNRPDKLNALNAQTLDELEDAFKRAFSDESVLAVVLTGAGEKAFVAGA
ncbi:MAG: enoyl-CoA hydratase, partial [Planctomycetota bacterium]